MPERERAGHRRTGIAARASSRWTESDKAALELARTRVSAALAASEGSKRPASSDRPAGESRSSRAPRIFRHTIREAFREWLFQRERERAECASVVRQTKPQTSDRSRSLSLSKQGIPDVSVATLAKVRAWVNKRRAETASMPTRENEKKPPRNHSEDDVFVSTNEATAARVCSDPHGNTFSSRYHDYVVKCAHLAFQSGVSNESKYPDEHSSGYFEENTSRWVPALCARRVKCRTRNADLDESVFHKQQRLGSRLTRHATFVFCPACHDAFLVRELTRCDANTSSCHACGSRVPKSATTRVIVADGMKKTTCVFCAYAARKNSSEKNGTHSRIDEREPPDATGNGLRTDSSSSHSSPATSSPACAFLDADDIPNLDALRAAVAGAAPGRVFLRWDAEARRARNAKADKRWRVSERGLNRGGEARRFRAARSYSDTKETDTPVVNWGFLHAGMPAPFAVDDFPARHAREFY